MTRKLSLRSLRPSRQADGELLVDGVSAQGLFNTTDRIDCTGEEFVGVTFHNCDFQHLNITNCRVDSCHFIKCNLQQIRSWDSTFSSSRFEHCDLSEINVSNGVIRECDFLMCRFPRACAQRSSIDGTRWKACTWKKSLFSMSTLSACAFVGKVSEVEFSGSADKPLVMEACDFSLAELRRVDFLDVVDNAVVWPSGPDYIASNALIAAIRGIHDRAAASIDPDMLALAAYFDSLGRRASRRRSGVIDLREIRDIAGAAGERVVREVLGAQRK